jgi:endonuclease V-like protein UPF0215 family
MKSVGNVKKEIRILGLDACNSRVIIGAIVRGGLYLDGILAFSKKISSDQLAREITQTKYFPELRIIMLHDRYGNLNPRILQRITQLPFINIPHVENKRAHGARDFGSTRYQDWSARGLDPSMLRRILGLTQVRGPLPEPARIAHLLAKLHTFGTRLQDKR